HDLVEGLVLDVEQRAVIGVHRGVADENVDLAVMLDRAIDERLDLVMPRDVAGNDMRIAAGLGDAVGYFLAGIGLARGNHDLAPSLASSSAEERPMPRLEPVTTATVPVRSNGVFFIVILLPECSRRHCKRSNPSRRIRGRMDCFVAALLAMTTEDYNSPPASLTRRM